MTHSWSRNIRTLVAISVVRFRYFVRAKLRLAKLPPGKLDPFDRSMDRDQMYFLRAAAKWGPVFKTWWHGGYATCVVDHARARQLLSENEDQLGPRSIDLSRCFKLCSRYLSPFTRTNSVASSTKILILWLVKRASREPDAKSDLHYGK